jgi:hypothetical protein
LRVRLATGTAVIVSESYLGHPTDNEADAFLLVKMDYRQPYLFNFEDEKYREAATQQFVRLPGGIFFPAYEPRPVA